MATAIEDSKAKGCSSVGHAHQIFSIKDSIEMESTHVNVKDSHCKSRPINHGACNTKWDGNRTQKQDRKRERFISMDVGLKDRKLIIVLLSVVSHFFIN